MIDFLKSWIFNIAAIAIFIVLLEILLPTGKMKKFVNFITGFILIIAIINPLLGISGKELNLSEFQIASSNFLDKRDITASSKVMEENQMQQIVELYRQKLISRLEQELEGTENISDIRADVLIDEDYEASSFGEIKRVYLDITLKDEQREAKTVSKVEKVVIDDLEKLKENKKNALGNEIDKELVNKLEERVNKLLEVKQENIVIAVQNN